MGRGAKLAFKRHLFRGELMPSATVPGFLVDAYNRPAVFNGSSGVLYRRTAADDRLRPRPPNHFADYLSLLSPQRYRELVSECRSLASRGLAAALLENKADYVAASGFRPRFAGNDTVWGTAATAALEDALKICNIRGGRFNWRASWRMAVPTRATDARFFVLLTKWATGWPAMQFLEGHRIGQREEYGTGAKVVGKDDAYTTITNDTGEQAQVRGVYQGLAINHGVITNSIGTEVAYRVLGPRKEDDQDISARDLIQVATPQRYSEGSPVPDIARALMDFLALDTAQTAQLDQQIADSKLTIIETNETGKQDPSMVLAGMAVGASLDGSPTEVVDRGEWRYAKSGSGKIEAFKSDRPSDQWMNFDERVAARAAAAIRWRAEMLDPSKLGGSATRAFQDQINTLIHDEFSTIAPAAVRVLGYFVSTLIGLKVIPNSPEWMRWEIAPPPWFEVDRASAKIDIDDVASGRQAMTVLHSRDGNTTREVYTARVTAYEQALEMQKLHPDVPLEIILGDLGATAQRTGFYPLADPTPDPTVPQPTPDSAAPKRKKS
jgi:hypothetical protein